jgi:hypothetical protein
VAHHARSRLGLSEPGRAGQDLRGEIMGNLSVILEADPPNTFGGQTIGIQAGDEISIGAPGSAHELLLSKTCKRRARGYPCGI